MYLAPPSPSNLGCGNCRQSMSFFRPNQALMRGRYASRPALAGMGGIFDNMNPTLLALGVGAAVLAGVLFFGKRRSSDKRRIAQLASRRALAEKALREAGA